MNSEGALIRHKNCKWW